MSQLYIIFVNVQVSIYLNYFCLQNYKLFTGEMLSEAAKRDTGFLSYKRSSEPLVNEMKLFWYNCCSSLSWYKHLSFSWYRQGFLWKFSASTPDKSKPFAAFIMSLLISKQSNLLLIYLLNTEALLAGAATETAFWPSAFVCWQPDFPVGHFHLCFCCF